MIRHTLPGGVTLFHADCRTALATLPDNSIDAVPCDPPYELNFMGKGWDDTGIANDPALWREVFRVLKPGGHLAAFSASRTYHRMACAIEDAGFEIRDSLCWLYGSGFPKSRNLDLEDGFCRCSACENNVPGVSDGKDDSARMAQEKQERVLQPIVSQQDVCGTMSSDSAQGRQGVDGRIETSPPNTNDRPDQSGMEGRDLPPGAQGQLRVNEVCSLPAGSVADGPQGRLRDGTPLGYVPPLPLSSDANGMRASSRPQSQEQRAAESRTVAEQPVAQDGGAWPDCGRCGKPMVARGLGTALKPAFEPIVLARKPLSEPTVAANVLRWRTGALNIDGCRVPTGEGDNTARTGFTHDIRSGSLVGSAKKHEVESTTGGHTSGRWPANVVTDGSDEVVGMFPDTRARGNVMPTKRRANDGVMAANGGAWAGVGQDGPTDAGDSGSAARFFYSAKASRLDRNGSKHPTVKPIALMQWLARLVTPPGGTILDPFAGSGTTGAAGVAEGFNVILCEREAEYVADIKARFDGSVRDTSAPGRRIYGIFADEKGIVGGRLDATSRPRPAIDLSRLIADHARQEEIANRWAALQVALRQRASAA